MRRTIGSTVVASLLGLLVVGAASAQDIVHDAEYYILEAQNGNVWEVEDQDLDTNFVRIMAASHPIFSTY